MGELIGTQLGRYHVIAQIGSGGMGDIYLAEQSGLGRQVAIKVVRGTGLHDEVARQDMERRFAQEARAVANLEHPHILPVYDYGQQDGVHYLAMQYAPDGSMADVLSPGPRQLLTLPLAPAIVADIIGQGAEALQYAHDQGVIHRDIKPQNLLVRVLARPLPGAGPLPPNTDTSPATPLKLHVLLADFGLARFLADLSGHTANTGTPLYSAPEQYMGRPQPASDQYALACVAYLLLTGRPVFDGTVVELYHQHLNGDVAPPSSVNPTIPHALDDVLARALAKEPQARYASVREFDAALRDALGQATLAHGSLSATLPNSSAQPAAPVQPVAPPPPPSRPVRVAGSMPSLSATAPMPPMPAQIPAELSATVPSAFNPPAPLSQPLSGMGAPSPYTPSPVTFGNAATAPTPMSQRTPPVRFAHEPDAPGAPIPHTQQRRLRQWRKSPRGKRAILIGLVVAIVLATGGSIAYTVLNRPPKAPPPTVTTVHFAHTGEVDLERLAALTGDAPPAQSPLAEQARSGATGVSADHIAALPALPSTMPANLSDLGAANLQTKFGLGQTTISAPSPMDTSIAAGSHFVIQLEDGVAKIYGYNGEQDFPSFALASFFAPVLQSGAALGEPRVLFDSGSGRWIIVAMEVTVGGSGPSGSAFDVALSDTDQPIGVWHLYQISTQEGNGAPCTWADSPQLGVNISGFYVTGNSFTCGANPRYRGPLLWALPKNALMAGTLSSVWRWANTFHNARHQAIFTLTPAVESGPDTVEWLVSDDAGYVDGGATSRTMIVWGLLNTDQLANGGRPSPIGVQVQLPLAYASPPSAIQAGTSIPLATGDARVTSAVYTGGHLYAAFTTAVNWQGDAATRSGVYWLDIAPSATLPAGTPATGTPAPQSSIGASVKQAQILGETATYLYDPALVADARGNIGIAAGVASPSANPSLVWARRHAGDAPDTLGGAGNTFVLAAGKSPYPGQHWGDYSGASYSPDGASIWVAGCYMDSEPSHWQTLVWQIHS